MKEQQQKPTLVNFVCTLYATVDIIVKEHLVSLEQINYWVLNVSVYTAAYTIKQ